jgi:hypothetical protein
VSWHYNSIAVHEASDLPKDTVGFVYQINNTDTGEYYIGKKILKHKRTKPPLKGKKRKRVSYVESDWKTYTGSSSITKKWSLDVCERVILHVCFNRTMMTYYEVYAQFNRDVFSDKNCVNDNILGKFYRDKINKYKEESLIKDHIC